ncbi:hypothetical protein [Methanimicrococcus hongohii]|uniref:hypothetical protein n=1 Tax=Methanimicrococcus hongohii TaxID=3028295 RepID=UPI00292CD265|nr:hypothetical protein [Methanimicrococcus sp. Hf6]
MQLSFAVSFRLSLLISNCILICATVNRVYAAAAAYMFLVLLLPSVFGFRLPVRFASQLPLPATAAAAARRASRTNFYNFSKKCSPFCEK